MRAEVELIAATTWEAALEELRTTASTSLLEELCEGMASSSWEGVSAALLSRWVVRIVTIVEALSEFWFAQDFVRFVDCGHLGFCTTLVRMCFHGGFPAEERVSHLRHKEKPRARYTQGLFDGLLVGVS